MKTIETTVYSYSELSEKAKEKAKEWLTSGDYWSGTNAIECYKEILPHLGIEVDHIYFSGFWSQGDGACFVGRWRAKDLVDQKAWRKMKWGCEELTRIRDQLSMVKQMYRRAFAVVTHTGHYNHENSVSIDVELDEENGVSNPEIEKRLTELLRDVMRWIYDGLEKDYEYNHSEEVIAEMMDANDYTFDEDGEFFG